MFEINFYDLNSIDKSLYTRVVAVCRYNGKWVYVRQKGKTSWEIPGGHIEEGETWQEAIKRELFEETGAIEFDIEPICVYSISKHALLCFAEIKKFENLPNSEIEEVGFFEEEPTNLTYPDTHTKMLKKVKEIKNL